MQKVSVCAEDFAERELLWQYIKRYYAGKETEISVDWCQDWPELADSLKKEEKDIVIVALNGVKGMDTVVCAFPLADSMIWISDLDFALQSFRLCIDYFFMKPITYMKMERALDVCHETHSING